MENEFFYLQEVSKCQNTDNGNAFINWIAEYSNGLESICFTFEMHQQIKPRLHVSELEKIKQKFL